MVSDYAALVRGAMADPSTAGILADWLEEHNRPRQGVLLRRRWKRWQTERKWAAAVDATLTREFEIQFKPLADSVRRLGGTTRIEVRTNDADEADGRFRAYLRRKFYRRPSQTVTSRP